MLERIACPITGTTRVISKACLPYGSGLLGQWASGRRQARGFEDRSYELFCNPEIGFYFQRWVPDEVEETERRHAVTAARSDKPAKHFSLSELSHKAEDAMLVRLLCDCGQRQPRVLDFAMGGGQWALMAKAYGSEIWGFDVDPAAATAAAAHGIRFATLDELPDGYFDFINADQVFEHLPQPVETLRRLARALAPGGYVKISTPADPQIETKLNRLKAGDYTIESFKRELHTLSPLCHINLFTARSLHALGEQAGLEPFQVPLRMCYAVMTDFHSLRQINRNFYNPWKRYRARGAWQFFRKPAG